MPSIIIATNEELRKSKLTNRERAVYEMERFEGLTRAEICQELKIKEDTRRCHFARAVKKISKYRATIKETPYSVSHLGSPDPFSPTSYDAGQPAKNTRNNAKVRGRKAKKRGRISSGKSSRGNKNRKK